MASKFANPDTIGPVLDFMCEQHHDPIFMQASLYGSIKTAIFQLQTHLAYSPQLRHMQERNAFYWLHNTHSEAIEPACTLFERYINEHKYGKAYQAAQEYLTVQEQNKRISDAISNAFANGYQEALEYYNKPINTAQVKKIGAAFAKGCQFAAELRDEFLNLAQIPHVAGDVTCGYRASLEDIGKPIDAVKAYKMGHAYNLDSIAKLGYRAAEKYLEHGFVLDDEWRTAKPHGPDSKGQHYRLNHEGGIITCGMGGKFNGLTENEAFGKKGRGKGQTSNAKSQPQKAAANAIPQSMLMGSASPQKAQPKGAAANAKAQPKSAAASTKAQPNGAAANAKSQSSAASRSTQLKSSSLTFSDIKLLRECILPFAGQISDLVDQNALEQLKAQYRSGVNVKSIEGICTSREIRALLQLGPRQYANSDLKDYPRLDFEEFNIQGNSNELQSAFNLLQANATAGNALSKLDDANLLELSETMRTHISQLNGQVAEVERMYAINLRDQTAIKLSKEVVSFKSAMIAITGQLPSTQSLHKRGAELVNAKMVESYGHGTHIQYPWLKFCLTQPDFHCASSFVAMYLDARKISAILSDNKDALVAHWGANDYEAHQAMIAFLTYQLEKAIELNHCCTVEQALDREFSRYDIAHVDTQQGGSYQPKDLNNALVVAPLSFREADSNNPNRHYGKAVYERHVDTQGQVELKKTKPFNSNCPFCVLAYELRRRGVLVEAKAYFEPEELHNGLLAWGELPPEIRLQFCSQSLWLNPVTGAYPDVTYLCKLHRNLYRVSDKERPHVLEKILNQLIEPGQRFHLAWRWSNGGGHIVDVEKKVNGELLIYDPQSSKADSVAAYFDECRKEPNGSVELSSLRTYRVDDCDVVEGLAKFAVSKFGSIDVNAGNLITHDRSLQMADDSNNEFADDIPEYVRNVCEGDYVEYCGEYHTQGKLWDVYYFAPRIIHLLEKEGLYPLLGYPQYLLLAKDDSDLVMMVSDEDLEITAAVGKQTEQLRKEGHKRRPEQLWV